jgi:hypothetical protein
LSLTVLSSPGLTAGRPRSRKIAAQRSTLGMMSRAHGAFRLHFHSACFVQPETVDSFCPSALANSRSVASSADFPLRFGERSDLFLRLLRITFQTRNLRV